MRFHSLVVLGSSLVISSSLHAALGGNQAHANRRVAIQGVTCPEIDMWTGGDPSGTVELESTAPGASAGKRIGVVYNEPIVLQASLPFSQPLLACVEDLCAGRTRPVTLLLSSTDHNGTTIGDVIEAPNAVLTEFRFPAIYPNANGKEAVIVTLIFEAERTQVVGNGAGSSPVSAPSINSKRAMAGNFRVTIPGLDTSRVQGTGDFIIKRPFGAGSTETTVSNFAVFFSAPAPDDWIAWRDIFLVKGDNGNAQEKSGAIELLSIDHKTVLFSVQFRNAGIMRLADISDKADDIITIRAQLYVESMSVADGPASLPAPKSSSTAPVTSENAPATRKSPVEAQSAPAEAAATEPAGTTVTNPEDLGSRDPADFPRPEGTVRTAFNSVRQKNSLQEIAKYTANQAVAQIFEFYEKALGGSGWVEGTRYENNFAARGAHQIQTTWTKDNRTATLTLIDTAPGSSDLQVIVQARL